jgi:hypothetical protein
MLENGLSRCFINKAVGRILRCFKWAVENEMVKPDVYHGLMAGSGLRTGRSEAVGVVFFIDPRQNDLAVFRFLTNADNALNVYESFQESFLGKVGAKMTEIEPGVVEVSFSLSKLQNSSFLRNWFAWILAWSLGYQVGGH